MGFHGISIPALPSHTLISCISEVVCPSQNGGDKAHHIPTTGPDPRMSVFLRIDASGGGLNFGALFH